MIYKLKLDGKVHNTGYTVHDAINSGWKYGDISWSFGYYPRENYIEKEEQVYEAGGKRKGWLYYNHPCWVTSKYHYKCYMYKAINPEDLSINIHK